MPNVLLVVLDCLRLDYWRKSMRRTRQATRGWFHFNSHWGVAHCSDPNHAALFTGYGPWATNVTTQMGSAYQEQLPTLFWRWKRETGGGTWAVMPLLVPGFYRGHVDLMAWHKGTDSADLACRAVRQFAGEAPGPWLGFIRDMTCHYPYLDLPMPPRGAGGEIRPQYERAVEHVDQFVDNLVSFVRSEWPDTIIIITSDHGELLGEHGEFDHLYTLYNVLVRVPMTVYVPGLNGKKSSRPTQHVDLMLTLCDLFGWESQGEGESWAAWMRSEVAHPAPAQRVIGLQGTGAGPVSEEHLNDKDGMALDPGLGRVLWRHRGAVRGPHKLVESVHANGARDILATSATDFRERKKVRDRRLYNLLPPVPDYHGWEQAIVNNYNAGQAQADDAIILERLQALGYA